MHRDSPFRDRMREFSARMNPPQGYPLYDHTDLAFRAELRRLEERLYPFLLTRMTGGSGFAMATIVRHFFLEYFSRFRKSGPSGFPSSFNVVESFLVFSQEAFAFDLRAEREHLLRLGDYLDWYASSDLPNQTAALQSLLPEGVIYAYNFSAPLQDVVLDTAESKLRVLGVALVRHRAELSAMVVAGEFPAYPPEDEVRNARSHISAAATRGEIRPDPTYSLDDRYVPELPNHSRVIMLARFDLERSRFDVRYINLDVGPSYIVVSDDPTIYDREPSLSDPAFAALTEGRLKRYESLFSCLASLIFLPAFFLSEGKRVVESRFATELHALGNNEDVRTARKILGQHELPLFRTIRSLANVEPRLHDVPRNLEPPDLEFESVGFWRPLSPDEIGEDKDGNPMVGKTWVERTESWSKRSLESFVISSAPTPKTGPDPGLVYVMRSGSHYADLYKIGLTRRDGTSRAAELSGATGVPTRFEVLAQWPVGDCSRVEAEVHRRLGSMRVNKRREFFRGNLQTIIQTIGRVVDEDG